MRLRLSILFSIIFLISGSFLTPRKTHADSDFSSSYNVTYEILDTGETQVTNNITITNTSNRVYATNYNLTINNIKIYDIKASSGGSALKTDVAEDDESTKVAVFFRNQIIGEGSQLKFNLSYKTKDISLKNGRILEVYIPNIAGLKENTSYEITLIVPEEFGPSMYIYPTPIQETAKNGNRFYSFSTDQVKNNSIVASFGLFQLFNFKLAYHLENKSFLPQTLSIVLPSDIKGRQQIIFGTLSKTPNSVEIDADGNYIAKYLLNANTDLKIDFTGSAKIVNRLINPKEGGQFNSIPKNLLPYTKEQKYWEVNNPKIQEIAQKLKDPNLTVSENAHRAYQFVTQTLKYKNLKTENKEVTRLGAIQALVTPDNAICMEFVDLFISITRAMGIPSREINGFAYAKNSSLTPVAVNLKGGDILHSWAEFYDPNFSWVQIDPTWGSTSDLDYFTKLDTNHIAFVVKGLNSEFPLPAGAYKLPSDDKPQVDVDINFNSSESINNYKLNATDSFGINPFEIFKSKKKITLLNTGNSTLYNINKGSIKILPPGFKKDMYAIVKNNKAELTYDDFEGKENKLEATIIPKPKEDINKLNLLPFVLIALLAFLLYMIFYFLLARLKFPKK